MHQAQSLHVFGVAAKAALLIAGQRIDAVVKEPLKATFMNGKANSIL
jgi:hypothetical protein